MNSKSKKLKSPERACIRFSKYPFRVIKEGIFMKRVEDNLTVLRCLQQLYQQKTKLMPLPYVKLKKQSGL